ncbi:MAG: hypothetical protein HC897_03940 [Thermoanaerobaculia bacterium]|nr:hypothetical protein [Thermoanaerobaculia bacterium]
MRASIKTLGGARRLVFRRLWLMLAGTLLGVSLGQAADRREADGPTSVVSPDDFFASLLSSTFNNPTGIRVGNKYHIYAQSAQGNPQTEPWEWCWGDPIVLFEADWSFEGLRSPFQLIGRISPCDCLTPQCPEANKRAYGTGSVLQSNHDGNFYIFLDKVLPGQDVTLGHFKDVIMGVSADGLTWAYPPTFNPLLTQSTITSGGNPVTVSILDVTMTAGPQHWWGFFKWARLGEQALQTGRLRITPDSSNPRGFRVEILSGGQYRAVANNGAFGFIPDNVWTIFGGINSIVETADAYEVWAWDLSTENVNGCDDASNLGSQILSRATTESSFGSVIPLRSRVRAAPTRNLTGLTFPLVLADPSGYDLMYTSSSNRACETLHSQWLALNNLFIGMEVVATTLSDAAIEDRFINTSTRPIGGLLANTHVEVGNRAWATFNNSVQIGNGVARAGDEASGVPFNLNDYPGERLVEVSADVETSGSLWTGIGLTPHATAPFYALGQVWMLLQSFGQWTLFADGTSHVLASGSAPAFQAQGFNNLRLRYDAETNQAEAWINGCRVTSWKPVPITPNIQAVGFHAFDPAGANAGSSQIDNFRVTVSGSTIFSDGFECGNLSSWTAVP